MAAVAAVTLPLSMSTNSSRESSNIAPVSSWANFESLDLRVEVSLQLVAGWSTSPNRMSSGGPSETSFLFLGTLKDLGLSLNEGGVLRRSERESLDGLTGERGSKKEKHTAYPVS